MIRNDSFLVESKSNIGWTHGFITCIGSIVCAYLTMMIVARFIEGDYALKIVPAIILTPLLISVYALWILFSRTIVVSLLKVVMQSLLLASILLISMKVA